MHPRILTYPAEFKNTAVKDYLTGGGSHIEIKNMYLINLPVT